MLTRLLISLVFALSGTVSIAGTMTAEIDKSQSSLDEPFWLTVAVSGSLDEDILVPETKDFEIIRTGESTNISIVNGHVTKERQYTYQVRALKEGRLKVPALTARVDGKTESTPEFEVDVKGGTPQPDAGSAARPGEKLLLVEREIPKNVLYVGEAVITKVRLLTRARLTGATPSRDSAPDWRLIPVEGQKNADVVRDGARWNVIELSEGLIPLKSGTVKAPAFGINATWIKPLPRKKTPRSVFDMFQQGMFQPGEEVSETLRSEQVPVTVKPLPLPKPDDFGDLVGSFTMTAQVSKRELSAGETATVTLEIKGQGALDRVKEIKIAVAGAKIYEDRPSFTEKVEPGAGLVSKRVLKFAVVPQSAGTLNLGDVKISSFNPFTERYEQLKVSLGVLTAVGGGIAPAPPQSATSDPVATPAVEDHQQSGGVTDPAGAPRSPEGHKPVTVPEVKKDQSASVKGSLILAIEFLCAALVISWLVIRRMRRGRKSDGRDQEEWRRQLADLSASLTSGEEASILKAFDALRVSLASPEQSAAAMTESDLIAAARQRGFPENESNCLSRVIRAVERRQYAGDKALFNDALVQDLRACLAFISREGSK